MPTDSQGTVVLYAGPCLSECMSGELTENVIQACKVQDGNGSYVVTFPKKPAMDMGVEPGDTVVFTGSEGESSLRVSKSNELLGEENQR